MPSGWRAPLSYLAIGAATLLVLAGLLYFAGIAIAPTQDIRRAMACVALAVLLVIAAELLRTTGPSFG